MKTVERIDDAAEADARVLDHLAKLGCDPSEPRECRHYVYLPREPGARAVAQALTGDGWDAEWEHVHDAWVVTATTVTRLSDAGVRETRAMLQGLAASYQALPVTAFPDTASLSAHAAAAFAQLWVIGLEIVAPALVALLITDAALGLVSRAVPQMNVFVVGLPAKLLVGFTVIAASLPFLSSRLGDAMQQSVAQAVRTLGG